MKYNFFIKFSALSTAKGMILNMDIKLWVPPASGKKYKTAVEKHSEIAKVYEEQYNTLYWNVYDKLTYDHMFKNISCAQGRVLDAGGGTGRWAREFAKKGFQVIVLDLSDDMLEIGKEYAKKENLSDKIDFIKGDICKLPFDNNKFDVVLSQGNPVSYSTNPNEAIKELSRVSKKGADVIISVHNKLSMIHYFCFFMGKISIDQAIELSKTSKVYIDYPIYAYTPKELEKVCNEVGLKKISLVGKQIISGYVQTENYLNILSNNIDFLKVIDLEEKYWEDESIIGMASHLEIICKKV